MLFSQDRGHGISTKVSLNNSFNGDVIDDPLLKGDSQSAIQIRIANS